ncbi:MAG: rhomboid family intramembrane serine protease [bacterium]|nr:rhomboid family intramembrane serine protease [bacterium]
MFKLTKFSPAIKYIILLTSIVFLLQTAVRLLTGFPWLEGLGSLILRSEHSGTAQTVPWWQVWRLLTYALLHYDFSHLFWNMLGLWLVGSALETALGSRSLTIIYIFSIISGGISALICEALGLNGAAATSILMGASAGTMGILFSFIALNPQSTMYFWLLVLIPIKALYLGIALILWQLGGLILFSASSTSYSAHLGGILAGYIAALAIKKCWGERLAVCLQNLRKRWQRRHIRVVK